MNQKPEYIVVISVTIHGESIKDPVVTMFNVELKSDTLKGLVNVISTLIDEVKFMVSANGMTLKAVDAAHVAMVEIEINKKAFDNYSAQESEMGLDLDKVKTVLKLASSGDTIKMYQDESNSRLVFKVGNITRYMNLVDTSTMSDPRVPQLSLRANVSIMVDELQKGMRAAESISDHIAIKVNNKYFELSCEGDTDSVSLKLEKSSTVLINSNLEVCSMFPLDYFSNILKAIPCGTMINMELDNNYPVKLIFTMADGNIKVNYLLAPRIESE